MKPDLSLVSLHHHGLCKAIERNGAICFNEKHCKGYCYKHYDRLRKYKSINLPSRAPKRCKYILCDNPYYSSGYCKNHYAQYMRRTTTKKCELVGCHNSCVGKYCSMHRTRISRYNSVDGSGNKKGSYFKTHQPYMRKKEYKICLAHACGRDSNEYKITKGLCPRHYSRWLKHGEYND